MLLWALHVSLTSAPATSPSLAALLRVGGAISAGPVDDEISSIVLLVAIANFDI
jgi:hypothetical protein